MSEENEEVVPNLIQKKNQQGFYQQKNSYLIN
jgi:hypothetical protein